MQGVICMQKINKRHSIMVSDNTHKELKKLKAELLVESNIEVRSLGGVVEYVVNYYKRMNENEKEMRRIK